MHSTWFLGDIHGCAEELADLLQCIGLSSGDRLIALGDLYHRGPDPHGVADLLQACTGFELVLGNHELTLLRRAGMLSALPYQPIQPLPEGASGFDAEDLRGDGGTIMHNIDPRRSIELLRLLERGRFFLEGVCAQGPLATRRWIAVHAGVVPGRPPSASTPAELTHLRQIGSHRGASFWYEQFQGPEIVIFGHTTSSVPRRQEWHGQLTAHGLDTGCVYGGSLTAWCMEEDRYEAVAAKKVYVR